MGRFALLLGTASSLADRSISDLPSVRHDLEQVRAAFDHAGDFDDVQVGLDLPRDAMADRIEQFFGARRHGDLAVLYYSGHGLRHPDQESLFLAASDTHQDRLHATAVDTEAILKDMLSRTYAKQKVVLLDCCFSGAFRGSRRFRGGMREEPRGGLRHAGTFILTSSSHGRASYADDDAAPSVFTQLLLDGMRGAAVPRGTSQWLTTHDLSHFVQEQAARRGEQQRPTESSEGVVEPIPLVRAHQDHGAGLPRQSLEQSSDDADVPLDADRWRRLLHYYISCVERSALLGSFVDLRDDTRYIAMPVGPEPVFGAGATPPMPDQAVVLARNIAAAGGELRYGYAVTVRRSVLGSSRLQFAPLLECDASVGPDGVLHTTLPPRVNAALAADRGLSDKEIDDIDTLIEETFVAGDPATVAATMRQLCQVLDLEPVGAMDPRRLAGPIRQGPLRRVQNCAVLFAVDAAKAAEKQLIDDLREIAKNPGQIAGTALGALALDGAGTMPPDAPCVIVAPDQLNEAQEGVIRAAMTRRLTVAQGPPGTGKSQLVTALVATVTAARQTVLMGSTNNQAVNEVSKRCDETMGSGLLIRSGNKQYLAQEPKLLAELISTHANGPVLDEQTPAGELRILGDRIDAARTSLNERALLDRDLWDLAIERQTSPAPDLPAGSQALHRLVRRADRGLRHRWLGWWSRRALRTYGVVDRTGLEEFARRVTVELRWLTAYEASAALEDADTVWRRLSAYTAEDRPRLSRALTAAQVARRVRGGTAVLQRRSEDLSSSPPRTWSRFQDLLRVLPAWATTALSVRKMPPRPAIFDLVVIDEAAACTIAAVLPMLFRARRALIIGDPRQLAPVRPLPSQEDAAYRGAAGLGEAWCDARRLSFTSYSAYDAFASAAPAVHLLDEHYRCHPQIVAAPNREVYQGRLVVLTRTHALTPRADPAVVWRHVPGRAERGTRGSGYNEPEVTAVIAALDELRTQFPKAELGVVTPLTAQQTQLKRALAMAGWTEDEVVCGTAHRFQGGQRDIMVISPVGAHGIADTTRNWLVNETNLWNVAITRAKAMLVVVGDQSWWSGQQGILSSYARGEDTEPEPEPGHLPAADALHRAASDAGLAVRRAALIDGYHYDLVLTDPAGDLAVLIDAPADTDHGRHLRTTLARVDLMGPGLPTRRVPAWRCLAEPDAVITQLRAAADRSAPNRPVPGDRP